MSRQALLDPFFHARRSFASRLFQDIFRASPEVHNGQTPVKTHATNAEPLVLSQSLTAAPQSLQLFLEGSGFSRL